MAGVLREPAIDISRFDREAWVRTFARTGCINEAGKAAGAIRFEHRRALAEELQNDPETAADLAALRDIATVQAGVTMGAVLKKLADMAMTPLMDAYKLVEYENEITGKTEVVPEVDLKNLSPSTRNAITGFVRNKRGAVVDVIMSDRQRALDMLMRHLGAYDDIKVEGKRDPFVEMLERAMADRAKALIVENDVVWDIGRSDADVIDGEAVGEALEPEVKTPPPPDIDPLFTGPTLSAPPSDPPLMLEVQIDTVGMGFVEDPD